MERQCRISWKRVHEYFCSEEYDVEALPSMFNEESGGQISIQHMHSKFFGFQEECVIDCFESIEIKIPLMFLGKDPL
jgi:hypothetical protein